MYDFDGRSIWYARYIDWTITTPLLLLEILLATGLPLTEIFTVSECLGAMREQLIHAEGTIVDAY